MKIRENKTMKNIKTTATTEAVRLLLIDKIKEKQR